jgi:site-specific DNA recombinase
MKLGIYTRVSTDEQAQTGLSLENQTYRGKEFAIKMGWGYKVFSDAGLSGGLTYSQRPGLSSLLGEMINKKIDGIYVINISRLSRGDVLETAQIKKIIKDNKVKLFVDKGEVDLFDINSNLLLNLQENFAEYERLQTGQRIKSVLERSVMKGKVNGGPFQAFGYTKDANKMLVVKDDEAEVVRLIYKLAIEGKGTKVIATTLNEKGILTKRGRTKTGKSMMVKGKEKTEFVWRDAVVYRILTNTLYKGERFYSGKIYECPAIVTKNTFELVKQKLSTRNFFKNTTNKYDYLLKGLIHCPVCEGKFYGHKRQNGKDNAYVCNSKRYGGEFCGNNGINIDYLDSLVMDNILKLDKITEEAFKNTETDSNLKSKLEYKTILSKNLKDTQTRLDNLTNAVELGNINPSIFKERFKILNKEKVKLLSELERTEKNLGIISQRENILEFVKVSVKEFKKIKTVDEKKLFIQNIVSRITLRWNKDDLIHMIGIFFRIDRLNLFMLSKEVVVNRTKRKENKSISTVISEKILISNAIGYGDEEIAVIKYS